MDIVVDTSVIVAVIVNEPHRNTLVGLTKGADLVAPASVHWEIGTLILSLDKALLLAAKSAGARVIEVEGW